VIEVHQPTDLLDVAVGERVLAVPDHVADRFDRVSREIVLRAEFSNARDQLAGIPAPPSKPITIGRSGASSVRQSSPSTRTAPPVAEQNVSAREAWPS